MLVVWFGGFTIIMVALALALSPALLLLVCVLCLHDSNKESLQRFPPAHLSHSTRVNNWRQSRPPETKGPAQLLRRGTTLFFPQVRLSPLIACWNLNRFWAEKRFGPHGKCARFLFIHSDLRACLKKRLFFTPVFEWNPFIPVLLGA